MFGKCSVNPNIIYTEPNGSESTNKIEDRRIQRVCCSEIVVISKDWKLFHHFRLDALPKSGSF